MREDARSRSLVVSVVGGDSGGGGCGAFLRFIIANFEEAKCGEALRRVNWEQMVGAMHIIGGRIGRGDGKNIMLRFDNQRSAVVCGAQVARPIAERRRKRRPNARLYVERRDERVRRGERLYDDEKLIAHPQPSFHLQKIVGKQSKEAKKGAEIFLLYLSFF